MTRFLHETFQNFFQLGITIVQLYWGPAMFAGSHFASQILEIGCNLVVSSACVMILGVRQDFVNEQTQF